MKKLLLFGALVCGIGATASAQSSISLRINHKLNGNNFAFNETGVNNLDQEFNADRLEYYLSRISMVHDGGIYTTLQAYTLVNAGAETVIDLGDLDAVNLESISFYVGVDQAVNHGDPSQWNPEHPLAPKFPSMHWGWAAGYRFLAIEGTDLGSGQEVQIHALGDENYFEVIIPLNNPSAGNDLEISVDANYEQIYKDVDISGGLISHGAIGPSITALTNMRDDVFSLSEIILSASDAKVDYAIKAFPNPSFDGAVTVQLAVEEAYKYDILVCDLLGKPVASKSNVGNLAKLDLRLPSAGIYFLNLSINGEVLHTEKLIVQ